ncbi:MAG: tetratricopeptide repeat protein [Burkholderiales bacterium]
MRLTAALLALFLLLPAPGSAQVPTREVALEALQSSDPGQRQRAAVWLAQVGRMDDVPALLGRLRDQDEDVRAIAERAIWVIWSRSGDPRTDALFLDGITQMNAGRLEEGIATFSRVIAMAPEFAEGWNKRATLYFLVGDFERSLKDCDEVIKRNPDHFGALAGYGQIYMRLNELERAVDYFKRALAVNPNLDGVEFQVRVLERVLAERKQKT